MLNIIRGTTPTLKYRFKEVSVDQIEVAYLTIKVANTVIIEKDINEAILGENYLAWVLTQQETLSIKASKITCQLNWRLFDGTRGASRKTALDIESNNKEAVI